MVSRLVSVGDVATYVKEGVEPRPGTIYHHYSLPSFDAGKKPEIVDGGAIRSGKLLVRNGMILVNKLNVRFGRVWNVRTALQNAICSTEFMPLVPEGVSRSFLYYTLIDARFTNELSAMGSGTSGSHQRVKPEWILDYRFALPDETTQCRVVSVLQAIDAKIDLNNRANDYLAA